MLWKAKVTPDPLSTQKSAFLCIEQKNYQISNDLDITRTPQDQKNIDELFKRCFPDLKNGNSPYTIMRNFFKKKVKNNLSLTTDNNPQEEPKSPITEWWFYDALIWELHKLTIPDANSWKEKLKTIFSYFMIMSTISEKEDMKQIYLEWVKDLLNIIKRCYNPQNEEWFMHILERDLGLIHSNDWKENNSFNYANLCSYSWFSFR